MKSYHFLLVFITFFVLTLFSSCSSKKIYKTIEKENSNPYFVGLYVYDPTTKKTIIDYNSDLHFTPASTTKLFTLYTVLKSLPDSIATVAYYDTIDKRYIRPLADPSFLYDTLPNKTYSFLKETTKDIYIEKDYFYDRIFGSGWSWDDYEHYYMPEKSIFPIYGNCTIVNDTVISPSYFQEHLAITNPIKFGRDFLQNKFYVDNQKLLENRLIPFKTSFELSRKLLSDTLQKPVYISDKIENVEFTPYISTPLYPVYKKFMVESDNFIGEQLMLIVANKKTGEYKTQNAIDYALDSLLIGIPQKPRWVDGSGLSRYNLFTPKSMVFLVEKMVQDFGKETVMDLLPKNGINGVLQNRFPSEMTFLYAKTGTLSNNHSLTGILVTKKGKFLIFSFMNNHYRQSVREVRKSMNEVLHKIYNQY